MPRHRDLALWSLVMLLLNGCNATKGSEVHLISNGYVGPVVILYGVPTGSDALEEDGASAYRIPPAGVLRLKTRAPRAGFYDKRYYYQDTDGARIRLPYQTESNVLQVFAAVDGVLGTGQRYSAYVVGVPSEGSGWAPLRDEATEEASRDPGA